MRDTTEMIGFVKRLQSLCSEKPSTRGREAECRGRRIWIHATSGQQNHATLGSISSHFLLVLIEEGSWQFRRPDFQGKSHASRQAIATVLGDSIRANRARAAPSQTSGLYAQARASLIHGQLLDSQRSAITVKHQNTMPALHQPNLLSTRE